MLFFLLQLANCVEIGLPMLILLVVGQQVISFSCTSISVISFF